MLSDLAICGQKATKSKCGRIGMKILITDDEESIRELIKYNVEKSGF